MKTEFRNRAFLPLVIPLGVVLGIAAVIAGFAFIMLYNSRETAVVLAVVMAAGILTSVALAASRDPEELDAPRKAAIFGAGATPIVIGVLIALGVGGIPAEELNINREEISVVPEDAPLILAFNSIDFSADQTPAAESGPGPIVRLPAETETTVVFDNQEADVPHNWTMLTEEGGDVIAATETENGPSQLITTVPPQAAGEYYYLCTIHPNMNGTVEVAEDVEAGEVAAA